MEDKILGGRVQLIEAQAQSIKPLGFQVKSQPPQPWLTDPLEF
jgi:hypothetical protein